MTLPPSGADQRQLVRISSTHERVRVVGENRSDVVVEGRADVERDASQTTVNVRNESVVVRVPEGTDLVIGTTSARIVVGGRVGSVAIVTTSGRISVANATSVDARSTSGRIVVGESTNDCRLRSVSGRISVESCGDADVATRSGRIELDGVRGEVHAHCVSGRIEVGLAAAHDVSAETVSGRIVVSLPAGVKAFRSPSPDGSSDDAGDADCTVHARSVSGRVDITSR